MNFHRFFPDTDPHRVTGQRLILAAVSLTSFLGALDMSIVNIANPVIIKSFQVSVGMGSLVILSYMLTVSALILIMGKLGRPIWIQYAYHHRPCDFWYWLVLLRDCT